MESECYFFMTYEIIIKVIEQLGFHGALMIRHTLNRNNLKLQMASKEHSKHTRLSFHDLTKIANVSYVRFGDDNKI